MISSVLATAGWPAELPALAGRRFDLTSGLNVLFGPNGSGKSTLLGLAATGAACWEPGWSSPVQPSDCCPPGAPWRAPHNPYPDRCWNVRGRETGKVRAEVVWDGSPTLHYAPHAREGGVLHMEQNTDGLAGVGDQDRFADNLALIRQQCSTGESRLARYRRLAHVLSRPPDLAAPRWQGCNVLWQAAGREFAEWIATLPRTGPIALLVDEPDRSLSIPNQHDLWHKILPMFAQRVQVVAASHCIFALDAPGANVVELTPGYVAECRALFRGAP